jgi:hypothetical protein
MVPRTTFREVQQYFDTVANQEIQACLYGLN